MKRTIKISGVYQYLEVSGVLDAGNEEAITEARKGYWKSYKREWRKRKRKESKEFTISLTPHEVSTVINAARKHKQSRTRFIKTATFAYINKAYIVPDEIQVREIAQLLSMTYNLIQCQFENVSSISLEGLQSLKQQLETLERSVLVILHNPKSLEQSIIEAVQQNPTVKAQLLQLLNSL